MNNIMANYIVNFNNICKYIITNFPFKYHMFYRHCTSCLKYPIITYNAGLDKHIAINENKKKIGVYRWVNKINNKTYVGSSIDLGRRFAEYYSYIRISSTKRKFPIHIALLKYGYPNFKLEILEYCDLSNLIIREQYYINELSPNYNVLNIAGYNFGFRHSIKTKEFFSKSRLGIKRVNNNKVNIMSNETRLKLSSNSHNAIPVILTNMETGKIIEFSSKNKAAEYLSVSQNTVKNYILKNKNIRGYSIKLKV